jgi:uncharacterized membrane protein
MAEFATFNYELIELSIRIIELIAIAVILFALIYGMGRYLFRIIRNRKWRREDYVELRGTLARALMLGLEILVAADIIKTVTLDSSLESVGVLFLLVITRIILSWSLVVETENRWPWQKQNEGTASE